MTQLAIAKLGTQANKGRKQTNCRGTALEILDQSTARKTRHQTQDHNKTRQEDRQRRAKQNRNRADETGQSDSQEAKRPKSKTPIREKQFFKQHKGKIRCPHFQYVRCWYQKGDNHSAKNSIILASWSAPVAFRRVAGFGRIFWTAWSAASMSGTCVGEGSPTVRLAYSSAK